MVINTQQPGLRISPGYLHLAETLVLWAMVMDKYLARHAEPESHMVATLTRSYAHVLCIPVFAEAPDFLDAVFANLPTVNVLTIVVVNARENCEANDLQRTQAIVTHLYNKAVVKESLSENMYLLEYAGQDVLLVDRCHAPWLLGAKQGVGKARKIACDITCRLITNHCIASGWIHVTDADATLPPDYFAATASLDPKINSIALYPFEHSTHDNPATRQAQVLYDMSLDYYVAGLAWAGSPWAFHTIGSTQAISADHYARVRGFPDRQAGEDFYLLNKLAKTGCVNTLECAPIVLTSRVSTRVPFGTGPALEKILAFDNPHEEFTCYNPACFVYLKCWLELTEKLWKTGTDRIDINTIENCCKDTPIFSKVDARILHQCLLVLGIDKALAHAFANSRSPGVFIRHLRNWFDAFMTLKFIHWLRDHHIPSVPASVIQDGTYLPFVFCPERNDQAPPALSQSQQ